MNAALILVALCVLAVVVLKSLKGKRGDTSWPVSGRAPLSAPEQVLYWRLCEAFPGHVVLAQVALSQLIAVERGANRRAVFNRFSQLVADFVVSTKGFTVSAVIELDDRSHETAARAAADARKTAVLAAAGYPLVRVRVSKMPTVAELRLLVGGGDRTRLSHPWSGD
jgi:Protein of unknown function (DUF2726)